MATVRRFSEVRRETRETRISVELDLDGSGEVLVETGIGFLDHMFTAWAFWARFDVRLRCEGDIEVDDHHTTEDCALALGTAFDRALGDRAGMERFGQAYAPMDETLARAVVDLSGRPYCVANLATTREMIGGLALENVPHFFTSFATAARANVHVDVLRGANDHHKVEAAFKSFALALRAAVVVDGTRAPSTKGTV